MRRDATRSGSSREFPRAENSPATARLPLFDVDESTQRRRRRVYDGPTQTRSSAQRQRTLSAHHRTHLCAHLLPPRASRLDSSPISLTPSQEQGITGQVPGYNPQQQQQQQQPPQQQQTATTPGGAVAGPGPSASRATTTVAVESGKRKNAAKGKAAAAKKAKVDASEGFQLAGMPEGPKQGRYNDRIPGAISMCGECGKRFTVTKVSRTPGWAETREADAPMGQYTVKNPLGGGLLCSPCSNESFEKPTLPKPKAAPKKRAVKTLEEREFKAIKTLQQVCINVRSPIAPSAAQAPLKAPPARAGHWKPD